MLERIICNLSGERILFNTATPSKFLPGKVIQIKLGGGNKAIFRISRVIKSRPIKTLNNGLRTCFEVWGKEWKETR